MAAISSRVLFMFCLVFAVIVLSVAFHAVYVFGHSHKRNKALLDTLTDISIDVMSRHREPKDSLKSS